MDQDQHGRPSDRALNPVDATRHIFDIGLSYVYPQAMFAAINLGLFDALATGPVTPEELARQLQIHPVGCRRLLVALRELELVEHDQGSFCNSAIGSYLTTDSPYPLRGVAMQGALFYRMCEFLPDALREYSPRWKQTFGTTTEETFSALYENPEHVRKFAEAMEAASILQGQEIARHIDFTPYRCLMDVAGGSGGISISIGRHYPHLRGIIMDVPPVCRVAEERIAANGLADRVTATAGDLIEGPYPSGADVIMLGWILHDWNDENCRTILNHCFAALPSGGALLAAEKVLGEDYSGTRTITACDLYMLAVCESGARERTEAEYRALLTEAGFVDVQVMRLETLRDVIVAKKP